MRFIPLNDLSHVADVSGMVKRTPMMVQLQWYKSLYVCWRVSWSLEALMSVILHLTLHLAISGLNVSYVWGRSGAKVAYIVGSILSRKWASLEGNTCKCWTSGLALFCCRPALQSTIKPLSTISDSLSHTNQSKWHTSLNVYYLGWFDWLVGIWTRQVCNVQVG